MNIGIFFSIQQKKARQIDPTGSKNNNKKKIVATFHCSREKNGHLVSNYHQSSSPSIDSIMADNNRYNSLSPEKQQQTTTTTKKKSLITSILKVIGNKNGVNKVR